ncbi:MAG TPA: BPTI/Kunitz-type proteinase inhibitor domain-containing protein, partial [Nannocystaceae bacterium]|nr:BPTI/Kunitz-type proteinase inhibitor domain-containing protein [Nannocystaceae bacterium]
ELDGRDGDEQRRHQGGCFPDQSPCGDEPAFALMYDTGPCDGAFIRFWFNPESMAHEEFSWGGCQGVVPFEDLASCQKACE